MDTYLWLGNRFPDNFIELELAKASANKFSDLVDQGLKYVKPFELRKKAKTRNFENRRSKSKK